MAEDEMVGWHHRLKGHEFEQAPGVGDGQGSLVCCSPWGCSWTQLYDWTELIPTFAQGAASRVVFGLRGVELGFLIPKSYRKIWQLKNSTARTSESQSPLSQPKDPFYFAQEKSRSGEEKITVQCQQMHWQLKNSDAALPSFLLLMKEASSPWQIGPP